MARGSPPGVKMGFAVDKSLPILVMDWPIAGLIYCHQKLGVCGRKKGKLFGSLHPFLVESNQQVK
jgi:hypothetical protein